MFSALTKYIVEAEGLTERADPVPNTVPVPQTFSYQTHIAPGVSVPVTERLDDAEGLIVSGFAVADVGLVGVVITNTWTDTQTVVLQVPWART